MINNINITWKDLFRPIPGIRTRCQNRICIEREVIPIIFVPGIMGSRLIRRSDKVKLWDPDDSIFMLNKYGWLRDAARRRKALLIGPEFTPEYAEVSNNDEAHNKRFESRTDPLRAKRGWGGVMWGSYGGFLIKMHNHRWPEPICHCFEMPVHAFGYNWCASNDLSGKALSQEIDRIIAYYRCGPEEQVGRTSPSPRTCNHVILVTHSMGGLVARSACFLHGAKDNVLGVVHGVQPVTGSPAAYWRMKAGFERPQGGPNRTFWDLLRSPRKMVKHKIVGTVTAKILGTDGEEVTSLLANMPGGLELLPTAEYVDNAGNVSWLKYPAINGEKCLPIQDSHEEIYKNQTEVYRMINPEWLNPQEKERKIPKQTTSWHLYLRYLSEAKRFHQQITISHHHPQTYQFYGTDLSSPDKIVFVHTPYIHRHPHVLYDAPFANKGTYATYVDSSDQTLSDSEGAAYIVMMAMPDGKGDGTVPESSGNALKIDKRHIKRIGMDEADWFSLSHQDIYSTIAAQRFVFRGIVGLLMHKIEKECRIFYRSASEKG